MTLDHISIYIYTLSKKLPHSDKRGLNSSQEKWSPFTGYAWRWSRLWPNHKSQTVLGPLGIRPRVNQQIIPEYTYAYWAGSAVDGASDFLILPCMSADGMNLFLSELSYKYRDKFILLISDGVPSHSEGGLKIPHNMMLASLPAYSPQLNPVENIWQEIREKSFRNLTFDSMDQLEMHLAPALMKLESDPQTVQSIAGFQWIISSL